MDFITQTMLGAAAGHAACSSRLGRTAMLLGAAGGALPDLDVLLSGLSDPALPSGLHRHFTHSLLFVPVGGLLAAAPFLVVPALRKRRRDVLLAATAGCATHAVLDCSTSYGTHFLWPFTDARISWDLIAIIDPLFTVPLLLALLAGLIIGRAGPSRVVLAWCLTYLGVGAVQHARALSVQRQLAAQRGHEIDRGRVMPTLGNTVLWRSVYEQAGVLHADAVRVPYLGPAAVRAGTQTPLLRREQLPEAIRSDARAARVYDGFSHFADGYVATVGGNALVVADMRYSLDPAGFRPLWGLRFEVASGVDVHRWSPDMRVERLDLAARWQMIREGQPGFVAVSSAP